MDEYDAPINYVLMNDHFEEKDLVTNVISLFRSLNSNTFKSNECMY